MARLEVIQYYDDIDNAPLNQDEVNVVKFGLDGTNYVLELSEKNAAKFREILAPYVKVARKDTTTTSQTRRTGSAAPDAKKIREWGRKNNFEVAERGKLPTTLIDAYRKATGK